MSHADACRLAFARALRVTRNKGTVTLHKPVTPKRVAKKEG